MWFGQNTDIGIHFKIEAYEVAKEINHSLLEQIQCLLSIARLDKSFWVEALVYASHLMNCLSSTAIGGKTPLNIWSDGTAQHYSLLWVFESSVYFSAKDGKVNPRAKKFVFWVSRRIWNTTNYGTLKTRKSCWVSMSRLMRLQYWSLPSFNRWRGQRLRKYRSGWLSLLHQLQLVRYQWRLNRMWHRVEIM